MKKLLLLSITIFILLTACNNNETDEFDFHGKVLGTTVGWNLLTVFVEDNHGGYDIELNEDMDRFDPDQYWVEAYRVQLTDETVFVDDESGEEYRLTLDTLPLDQGMFEKMFLDNQVIFERIYNFGRGVSVKVAEEFDETLLDDREGYILQSQEFLPIYTAEEIRFLPLTYEDFLFHVNTDMSEYKILIIYEGTDEEHYYTNYEEHWEDLNELYDQLTYLGPHYINLTDMEKDFFLQYPVPVDADEYPFFLIIDGEDQLLEVDEWDEVLDYFIDHYGR